MSLFLLSSIKLTVCMEQNPRTIFFNAADTGDIKTLQTMLDAGYDPNERDANGQTVLHRAVRFQPYRSNSNVLRFLLNYNNTIRHNCSRQMLALAAASHGRLGVHSPARILVQNNLQNICCHMQKKLDINAQDMCGKTALHYAIMLGYEKDTSLLLEAGANTAIADFSHDQISQSFGETCGAQNDTKLVKPKFIPSAIHRLIENINNPENLLQKGASLPRIIILTGENNLKDNKLPGYIVEKTKCLVYKLHPEEELGQIKSLMKETTPMWQKHLRNIGYNLGLCSSNSDKPIIMILKDIDVRLLPREEDLDFLRVSPADRLSHHDEDVINRIHFLDQIFCEITSLANTSESGMPKVLLICCSNRLPKILSQNQEFMRQSLVINEDNFCGRQTVLHKAVINDWFMRNLLVCIRRTILSQMLSLACACHHRTGKISPAKNLDIASLQKIFNCVLYFNINAQDAKGNTALHYATLPFYMHHDTTFFLELFGADCTITNNDGKTAEEMQTRDAYLSLIEWCKYG